MSNDITKLLKFDGLLECGHGSNKLRFEHRFHQFGNISQPMPLMHGQYEQYIKKFRMTDCNGNLKKMFEQCSESFKFCIQMLDRLRDPMHHFRSENQFQHVLSHETDYWDCVLKVAKANLDACRNVYKKFVAFTIKHKSLRNLQNVQVEDGEMIHVKCDFDTNLRFLSFQCD